MIPKIILKEWEIIWDPIEIHVTELESFLKCEYKYKYWKWFNWNPDVLYEWDISEQLLTQTLYWKKLSDVVLRHFANSKEFPNYSRLQAHADNLNELLSQPEWKERFPIFTQKRMKIIIDYAPYRFHLIWTADWIFDNYVIADCKTSANKWYPKDAEYKLQWKLYPRMLKQITGFFKWQSDFEFVYFIFTKQKTAQLQIMRLKWDYEDSENLLKYILSRLSDSIYNNSRDPKRCLDCRRCPLKSTCPLWSDVSDEDNEIILTPY